MEDPRMHILLPVHNRRATTVRFVTLLAQQTWRSFRLILIDDGSRDGTAEAVRALWPAAVILTGTGDWWWAGSLARGCEWLERVGVGDREVLLLINDDVEIAPDFLASGLAELAGVEDTLLLARQIDAADGREIDGGGGVRADVRHLRFTAACSPEETNCLPTRGLFLRWADMRRAGGFRPRWLPHYLSDYEFTLRAARAGLKLKVAARVAVRVHGEQTGRSLGNLFREPRRGDRLRLLFSPRFKDNPVTWSAFVWLAAPALRRPYLLLKVWAHFIVMVARALGEPAPREARP